MQHVIITGATSMIGIATLEACIAHGIKVSAIIRKNSKRIGRIPHSDLVRVIFANAEDMAAVEVQETADALYHFMWEHTRKEERDDPKLQEKNIRNSLDAVELAHRCGCKKIICAGSQAEYGTIDEIITEEMTANPQTAYGRAKLLAFMQTENLCESYSIELIWGRIFSVYGRYDNEGTMIDSSISGFLNKQKVFFSAGLQIWNYLNEWDTGKIFYLLGEKQVEPGIYNIANKESRILKDYIVEIIEQFPEAEYEFSRDTKHLAGINPDVSKLIRQIGDFEMIPFKLGIEEIIHYRKKLKVMP